MKTYVILTENGTDLLWDSCSCVRLDSRLSLRNLITKSREILKKYQNWKKGTTANGFRIFKCCSLLDSNYTLYETNGGKND